MGIGAAVAAIAFGAVLVEKHFTLRRADGGVDASFSLEPEEMSALVRETQQAWQAIGSVRDGPTEVEKPSLHFRRSLYFSRELAAGAVLTRENVRCMRPGLGLAPKHLPEILGRKTKQAVRPGTPVSWDLLA